MNQNWCYLFPKKSLLGAYSTLKHSLPTIKTNNQQSYTLSFPSPQIILISGVRTTVWDLKQHGNLNLFYFQYDWMWQVSMTSKRKGWPGQLPNQSGYCPLPLFPALFYPVIVNVESSYNNILDTLDLTVSKSWAPSLSVFLWKQPWFPLPFFTIQWEEISYSVWCCPVKVKAAVKNSSSRTALALAVWTLLPQRRAWRKKTSSARPRRHWSNNRYVY